MQGLEQRNPIAADPDIWEWVFPIASDQFEVPITELLNLSESWDEYDGYSKNQIQSVIDSACEMAKITEEGFWRLVIDDVRSQYESIAKKWERRCWALERIRLSVSLPDNASLAIIQRYEVHLTRQFYKPLHELQRLQANRQGSGSTTAAVVDIEVKTPPSAGKT